MCAHMDAVRFILADLACAQCRMSSNCYRRSLLWSRERDTEHLHQTTAAVMRLVVGAPTARTAQATLSPRGPEDTTPAERIARGRVITLGTWAWVELNYRPHAYQGGPSCSFSTGYDSQQRGGRHDLPRAPLTNAAIGLTSSNIEPESRWSEAGANVCFWD